MAKELWWVGIMAVAGSFVSGPSEAACPSPVTPITCTTDTDCADGDATTENRCVGPTGAKICRCTQDWLVVGQGGANGDCMMEWLLAWPPNLAEHTSTEDFRIRFRDKANKQVDTHLICADGAACDLDGEVNGRCEFELSMCFCVGDLSIPECGDVARSDATAKRYCKKGTDFNGVKPRQFRLNPPGRPELTGVAWPAEGYTCGQYYAQRLKERLIGRPDVGEAPFDADDDESPATDGEMTEGNTTGTSDNDASYRATFANQNVGVTFLSTPAEAPRVHANTDTSGWPCTVPQRVIVPLERECKYKAKTQQDGRVKKTWKATYKTGRFEPKGYFERRTDIGQKEIDRSGDRLRLECRVSATAENPIERFSFDNDPIPPTNHCVFVSAGCCAQPGTKPQGAPDTNCCKVSPSAGRDCCLVSGTIPNHTGNVTCE